MFEVQGKTDFDGFCSLSVLYSPANSIVTLL